MNIQAQFGWTKGMSVWVKKKMNALLHSGMFRASIRIHLKLSQKDWYQWEQRNLSYLFTKNQDLQFAPLWSGSWQGSFEKIVHQCVGLKGVKQMITCSVWDIWKKCLFSLWSMYYSRMNPSSLNDIGFLFRSTLKVFTGRVWEWLAFLHSECFSLGMINISLSSCWDHPEWINLHREFWFKMNDSSSIKAIFWWNDIPNFCINLLF